MGAKRRLRTAIAVVGAAALIALATITVAGAVTGVPTPVTVGGVKPETPAVSGNRVVWSDYRLGHWDLWLYDASTKVTRQITSGPGDKMMPAISGDTIVYVQYGDTADADLYIYDIASGTSSPLVTTPGDQLNPTVSGSWIAWEENSSAVSNMAVIKAYNRATNGPVIQIASGGWSLSSGSSMHRPKAAGDVLVYEQDMAASGDANVRMYNFTTGVTTPLAATANDERMPTTDGRFVVWSQGSADTGYDIYAYDTTTGLTQPVATDPGEQSLPVVGNGVVTWIDAGSGAPKVVSKNLVSGARNAFPYRGSGAVAGFSASGDSTAWLQQAGSRWQVKALFGSPVQGLSLASLVPTFQSLSNFRLALLSANGDVTAPAAVSTSVSPGQTNVSRSASFKVAFSKNMNSRTVNGSTVRLVDTKTRKTVPATVRYSWLSRSAVVTPSKPLASGSFALVVAPTVADTSGNSLAAPVTVAFSTSMQLALGFNPPSQPMNPQVNIRNSSADVTMTWSPSTDDVGVTSYRVKRYTVPLTGSNWSLAETLTPVSSPTSTTVLFAAKADEKAKKSTYYYAVAAIDGDGMMSPISDSTVPDPHGAASSGAATCQRCHQVHGATLVTQGLGALGARGAKGCYKCHGTTNAGSTVGTNSVNNVQADFSDYPYTSLNPTPAAAPSRHGNQFIRAQDDNQQCDMCHAQHRKPYDDNVAKSFSQLLKRPSSATATAIYSLDGSSTTVTSFNENFCFTCHGASVGTTSPATAPYAYMTRMGGATAYDNAAGDHNQASWTAAATAHGTQNMTDTARTVPNGTTLPKNNCEVCHDKHGSQSRSLLGYRRGTTTGLDESGLCFKCHSAAAVSPDATATNNAWNKRDVKAQFSLTGSTHPTSTVTTYGNTTSTVFVQDLQSDFNANTMFQTVTNAADGNGSVVLNTTTTNINPPSQQLLFWQQGGGQAFDQYKAADAAWNAANTANFDPLNYTTWSPGSGSSAYTLPDGRIVVTRGGAQTSQSAYTAPANSGLGTWAAVTALPAAVGAGSEAVVNTTTACAYVSRGGSSNAIMWWTYGNTTTGSFTFSAGNLGVGSAMAYVPAPVNKLFVAYNDSATGDGRLYYANNPGTSNTAVTFTQGAQIFQAGSTRYNRMVWFKDGNGADHLFGIGRDSTGTRNSMVVNTPGGTPAVVLLGKDPFGGTSTGDGVDLVWDGGSYLYALRGGTTSTGTYFARIAIPADGSASGNWGAWETLPNSPNVGATPAAGTSIALTNADPAPYTGTGYFTYGTATTGLITPAAPGVAWDNLQLNENLPAGTNLKVSVQDAAGTTIPGFSQLTANSINLSTLTVAAYPQIKLFAEFYSDSGQVSTPRLDYWQVSSAYLTAQKGTTTCYNCHNTHFVQEGTAGTAWSMSRASNPTDTNSAYAGTSTAFCQACHGGTNNSYYNYNAGTGGITISAITNSAQLIPYAVQMRPISASWPYFTGWYKGAFSSAGHFTTTGTKALCENCHDPHGSNHDSLLAWTTPSGYAPGGVISSRVRDNTDTVSAQSNLCLNCHGNSALGAGSLPYKGATAVTANGVNLDVATPMNAAYGHGAWIETDTIHKDTEGSANLGAGKRHAECADCHDPHSAQAGLHTATQSKAGSVLIGAKGLKPTWPATLMGTPTSYTSVKIGTAATDYEAYVCLKCHSANVNLTGLVSHTGGVQETDVAAEFNPANLSGHNVMGAQFSRALTQAGTGSTWAAPTTASLGLSGTWTNTSMMTCSDCHSSTGTGAGGPHGSSTIYMLKYGAAGTEWYTTAVGTGTGWPASTANFCAGCHTTNPHGSWFASQSQHYQATCDACHIRIPHGWKRPRMLGYRGVDSLPYVSATTGLSGLNGNVTTANNPSQNQCATNCGGHSAVTNPW